MYHEEGNIDQLNFQKDLDKDRLPILIHKTYSIRIDFQLNSLVSHDSLIGRCHDSLISRGDDSVEFNHRLEHTDVDMLLIQANIDDMNPEFTSYITERLFDVGANDVYWIPIIMKKGRPGLMLNVLVQEDRLDRIENIIFSETTTLGLRYLHASCHRLGREFVVVETLWGPVHVKAGYYQDKLIQYAPEFSECEAVARNHKVPLKMVYDEVKKQFSKKE